MIHCDADLRAREEPEMRVQRDRPRAGLLHVDLQMVLQVAADAGPVGDHLDAVLGADAPAGPMPDSIRSFGELIEEAETITSLRARTVSCRPQRRIDDADGAAPLEDDLLGQHAGQQSARSGASAPGGDRRWRPTSDGPSTPSSPSARSLPAASRCSRRCSRSPPRRPALGEGAVERVGERAARHMQRAVACRASPPRRQCAVSMRLK